MELPTESAGEAKVGSSNEGSRKVFRDALMSFEELGMGPVYGEFRQQTRAYSRQRQEQREFLPVMTGSIAEEEGYGGTSKPCW